MLFGLRALTRLMIVIMAVCLGAEPESRNTLNTTTTRKQTNVLYVWRGQRRGTEGDLVLVLLLPLLTFFVGPHFYISLDLSWIDSQLECNQKKKKKKLRQKFGETLPAHVAQSQFCLVGRKLCTSQSAFEIRRQKLLGPF